LLLRSVGLIASRVAGELALTFPDAYIIA
jgi:hypothetical protein